MNARGANMIGCNRLLRFGGLGAPLVCGVLYLALMMKIEDRG